MQWFDVMQKSAALLSRMYLVMVVCFGTWALLPMAIGWTPTVVMSGSMLPNIQIGDVVVAQNLSPEQKETVISTGFVLLATDPLKEDRLVTHRVVNILKGSGYITKGDANDKADATMVPIEKVHGIERLRIPMIGIPIQASRQGDHIPLVLFTGITAFAQLLVLNDRRINSNKTKQKLPKKTTHNNISRKCSRKKRRLFRISSTFLVATLIVILSFSHESSEAAFAGTITNSSNTFATTSNFALAYKNNVIADSPLFYYRLNEAMNSTVAADSSGNNRSGSYSSKGITYRAAGALTRDSTDTAVTLNGSTGFISTTSSTTGPQSLTTEIWFKTTSVSGGKLIGFGAGTSASSTIVDRVLYMTNTGKVAFGIDSATKSVIQTPLSYNDGKWHMAVATLSGLNASLYIDGQLISSGIASTAPTTASGFWVVGGNTFSGWGNQPTSSFFAGSVDEVAVYTKALTAAQIAADYGSA